MIWRVSFALFAWVLLSAQTPMVPGFPPGTFQSRAALDAAPPASYVGLVDINGTADICYSLRACSDALAAATTNLADIVDTATGAASCTIKAKTTGEADLTSNICVGNTVSVTTFCTVTHPAGCSVSRWYDQSANALHVTQATLSDMPLFVLGSISGISASQPCINFPLFTGGLINATGLTMAQPLTISTVAGRPVSTGRTNQVIASNSSNVSVYFANGANTMGLFAGDSGPTATANDGKFHAIQGLFNNASSSAYVDGVSTAMNLGTTLGFSGQFVIGRNAAASSQDLEGYACEVAGWAADKSANNATVNSNQQTFWGIVP